VTYDETKLQLDQASAAASMVTSALATNRNDVRTAQARLEAAQHAHTEALADAAVSQCQASPAHRRELDAARDDLATLHATREALQRREVVVAAAETVAKKAHAQSIKASAKTEDEKRSRAVVEATRALAATYRLWLQHANAVNGEVRKLTDETDTIPAESFPMANHMGTAGHHDGIRGIMSDAGLAFEGGTMRAIPSKAL
jgi:hypothetical protein